MADRMDEVLRALGRIEGSLNGVVTEQQRLANYTAANSGRIGTLERRHDAHEARVKGWAAGAGAVGALLVTAIKWLVMGQVSR
jgi:hypothetical protein